MNATNEKPAGFNHLARWEQWQVPPLWVWVVGALLTVSAFWYACASRSGSAATAQPAAAMPSGRPARQITD